MRLRVLNTFDMSHCPDVLRPLECAADVVSMEPRSDVVRACIGQFDAYLASLALRVDQSILDAGAALRVIATASTGTDHIDVAAAERKGIAILSLKDDQEFLAGITATAELAWALLLTVMRRLHGAIDAAGRGDWARDRYRGHQLSGKTLGIVGYGRLGRMVAEYGVAFRMQVLACDVRPVVPAPGVRLTSMEEVLATSDIVSLHVHLTEGNRGLIGRAAIAAMKSAAVLINTSRGAVVDEAALLTALESGRLAGAGLDVIDGEWRQDLAEHPLIRYARTHENLVITPHIGGVTYESQELAYARIVAKLADYLVNQAGPARM